MLVADNFLLAFKSQAYHFNVVGPDFHQYHALFGGIYESLFEWHDTLSEQQRQLNTFCETSLKGMFEQAVIEDGVNSVKPSGMVSDLVDSMEAILAFAQKLYDEAGSESKGALETIIGDYMTVISKHVWMLRSMLQ